MFNKSKIHFHSCDVTEYDIRLSLLPDIMCNYIFWLKLVIMKSFTDTILYMKNILYLNFQSTLKYF
jgi:hypothetical protein